MGSAVRVQLNGGTVHVHRVNFTNLASVKGSALSVSCVCKFKQSRPERGHGKLRPHCEKCKSEFTAFNQKPGLGAGKGEDLKWELKSFTHFTNCGWSNKSNPLTL